MVHCQNIVLHSNQIIFMNIVVSQTIDYVKKELQKAEGGHDWWHIKRVHQMSLHLAEGQDADLLVVELAALLHDIADSKFHDGNEEIGPQKTEDFLRSIQVSEDVIQHVVEIIRNISFKGGNFERRFNSLELNIVQDADRLDAIGAIGIARAFNYGGFKNRALYDPRIQPDLNMNKEAYKKSTAPTINHFYEKLLLLKDLMNTPKARGIAEERHAFMKLYLEHFFAEWKGAS